MALEFPIFPSVPSMTADAQAFVEDMLTEAREAARNAVETANETLIQLRTVTVPEPLPAPPTPPSMVAAVSASYGGSFGNAPDLGEISVQLPEGFVPDQIDVPDIMSEIPEYVSLLNGINIPAPPEMIVPEMPTEPSVETEFEIEAAPTPSYGELPDLTEIVIPEYEPITLEDFTDEVPEFTAAVPNANIQWSEPTYQAQLASAIQTKLAAMLAGGTGIDPVVEDAIWQRDRERLHAESTKSIDEAHNQWAARGFALPPGALLAQVAAAQKDSSDKVAALSRDVSIKQADLEQKNRQFAIEQGIVFEKLYVDIFLQVTQRSFEIAKETVTASISIFNAQVAAFNVEQQIFSARIERYKAKLQYALSQIDAYKARIDAERVKSEVNKNLIDSYDSKVKAYQSQVEAYRAVVQAATARAELQKNKVDIYRAQIEGRVAQIGAKKVEFDAYVARVQGEQAKVEIEKANAQAYSARVGALTAAADVSLKVADIDLAISKQKLDYAVANLQRLGQLASLQLASIQARGTAHEAETRRGVAVLDSNRSTSQLNVQLAIENGRNIIANYTAQIAAWTARVQQIIEIAKVNATSIAAAGQVASNLAAGALAGTSVSAGFNGGVSRSEGSTQSQNYSESKSEATSDSNSYTTNHNYNHEV